MNDRRKLLLGGALAVLGLGLQLAYVRRFEAEASGGPRVQLLAAARTIERGTKITADLLTERAVPQAYVDERAIRASERDSILELRAVSKEGLAVQVKLTPWAVPVQHEDVVFETGKWEIRPSEEQKLDASFKKIVEKIEEVRKNEPTAPVKLYIAGHTDTVGGSAENRTLSLHRARAIGT